MYKWQTQTKIKLTKMMLDVAAENSILIKGTAFIPHPWFNQAKNTVDIDGQSTLVKFIVKRGVMADWCIYHSLDANLEKADNLDGNSHLSESYLVIARFGAKLYGDEAIRGIIDCDEEVMNAYRH